MRTHTPVERSRRYPDGPSVVALGGGHGLASSLRAARQYAGSITGIVSVGDDGGSSGRLRAEFGVAPPGDLRRCLSALATDGSLLARSLEHRFDDGSLRGHPIGNLLLTGLTFACGDLQQAIDEIGRLVGAEGRVFPAADGPVTLVADSDDGPLTGQVTIERATGVRSLRHQPEEVTSPAGAVAAILDADQIVVGPGSLFTSVLATAVLPDIKRALQRTSGQRVFVTNVAGERGAARGFGPAEHVETLHNHGIEIDVVLTAEPTPVPGVPGMDQRLPVVSADVAAGDGWSHDPVRLGRALRRLWGTP